MVSWKRVGLSPSHWVRQVRLLGGVLVLNDSCKGPSIVGSVRMVLTLGSVVGFGVVTRRRVGGIGICRSISRVV